MLKRIYMATETFILGFKKKKDIIFVVRNKLMLTYARAVYEILEDDNRLRLWICLYEPYDADDEEIKALKAKPDPRCISYFLARYFRWDLIIFPDHKPEFRADCYKIYIDHALCSGRTVDGDVYEYGSKARDRSGNIIYNKIFVASHFLADGIKNYYPEVYPYIRVVGNLFIDKVIDTKNRKPGIFKIKNLDHNKTTIVIASSWRNISLIHNFGLELMEKLPGLAKQYNIIITIHYHNYYFRYPECLDWKNILGKIDIENVCVIEPGTEPYHYLAQADLLIMDMTSLGLYFPICGKPIIFWDNINVKYVPVNLIDELRKAAYVVNDISNLDSIITNALSDFDEEKMKTLSNKISNYQGDSANRIKNEIYQSIHLVN